VHGERWRAVAHEKILPGERVEVDRIDGLVLTVKKAEDLKT
jgi:membrane-bound ClpP family serine protease